MSTEIWESQQLQLIQIKNKNCLYLSLKKLPKSKNTIN